MFFCFFCLVFFWSHQPPFIDTIDEEIGQPQLEHANPDAKQEAASTHIPPPDSKYSHTQGRLGNSHVKCYTERERH